MRVCTVSVNSVCICMCKYYTCVQVFIPSSCNEIQYNTIQYNTIHAQHYGTDDARK